MKKVKRKVTAKDVAAAAGVSLPAVSLAFRGYGRQKAETREKILKIAEKIGYRPNLLVDSFHTGRTRTIGVMMAINNEPSIQLFQGIEQRLGESDNVPIVLTPDKNAGEKKQLHRLLDRRVDGIIMVPHEEAMFEEHLEDIFRRDIPFVVADNPIAEKKYHPCFVGTDDYEGGRMAAKHLLDLGHRKFGILSAGSYPQPMHFRREGFESEIRNTPEASVFSMTVSSIDQEKTYSTAIDMLMIKPTAVFVTLDPLLPILYKAAHNLKILIPEDISVLGFAGLKVNEYLNPPAASMMQPFVKIGETAADLLLKQIDGKDIPEDERQIRFLPKLIPASSIASLKIE